VWNPIFPVGGLSGKAFGQLIMTDVNKCTVISSEDDAHRGRELKLLPVRRKEGRRRRRTRTRRVCDESELNCRVLWRT